MTRPARLPAIDLARGLALIGMGVFHFTFDLQMFGLIAPGTVMEGGWALFARLVAGSFVFLAGVSLVMWDRAGADGRAFWRGTGLVALAALGVSAATLIAMPGAFVFFGVLHVIVACRLLGLGLRRLPTEMLAAMAVAVFAASYAWSHPAFDARALAWIGFAQTPPFSIDFLPLFPWLAPFLAGMAWARMGWIPSIAAQGIAARALVWAGQRSLWIYLAHQPILIALIWAWVQLFRA